MKVFYVSLYCHTHIETDTLCQKTFKGENFSGLWTVSESFPPNFFGGVISIAHVRRGIPRKFVCKIVVSSQFRKVFYYMEHLGLGTNLIGTDNLGQEVLFPAQLRVSWRVGSKWHCRYLPYNQSHATWAVALNSCGQTGEPKHQHTQLAPKPVPITQ